MLCHLRKNAYLCTLKLKCIMKQYLYLLLLATLVIVGGGRISAAEIEQELAQRVQQAQVSGSDSDFYNANKIFRPVRLKTPISLPSDIL